MKRSIAALLMLAALGLSACGGEDAPEAAPEATQSTEAAETTPTPEASPSPTLAPEVQKFVDAVSELPSFEGGDPAALVAMGLYSCDAIKRAGDLGEGLMAIIEYADDHNINGEPEDYAKAAGYAGGTLCPEVGDSMLNE